MKYQEEKFVPICGCRSVGECRHGMFAWKDALEAAVNDFAKQMKRKLIQKALQGESGWDNPNWSVDNMKEQLVAHVDKGDPIDVANFAMFIWNAQGGNPVPKLAPDTARMTAEKGDK